MHLLKEVHRLVRLTVAQTRCERLFERSRMRSINIEVELSCMRMFDLELNVRRLHALPLMAARERRISRPP